MERWPTRDGISVPPHELELPRPRTRETNNHHNHWTRKKFEQHATLLALRNLERHQYVLPVNVHNYIHATYDAPEMPTEGQAAREVIDAYDQGEQFKVFGRRSHQYYYKDIPKDLIDGFVAKYSLIRVFDMAAD